MKPLKAISLIVLPLILLVSSQSCLVLYKKDNGKHKGWYKNKKNPHNPKYNKLKDNKNALYEMDNNQMPYLQHIAQIDENSNWIN